MLNIKIMHPAVFNYKIGSKKITIEYKISSFRRVVNVCFLLGNSPASEFDIPTFRNTVCSIFIGR
jgi:hypothetical protein